VRSTTRFKKAKFHRTHTDTHTDFLADFLARIVARKSARRAAAVGLPRAPLQADCRGARGPFRSPDLSADFCPTRAFPAFPREDVRWRCARVTRVRELYMINYRVYTFTKLHDRRIPKVRVGVGPMEFKDPVEVCRGDACILRLITCTYIARSAMLLTGLYLLAINSFFFF